MQERKIKVAQIVGDATTGGVISCVLNFYRHIDRDDFQFDFYSYAPSKFDEEIKALGGNVFYVPKAIRPLSHISKLKKLLKQGDYDIVHAHLTTLSAVSLLAAKQAKVKVRVCHAHNTTCKNEKTKIVKDMLRPFSKTFATHTAGCSEHAIEWLFGEKTAKTSFVLHNAINLEAFAPNDELRKKTRRTLGIDEEFVFGTIGRFVYQKNYKFLIDAFAIYAKNNPNGRLLLVGDGKERNDIINRINSYGISDRVSILDEVNDVQKYYSAFDCFVLPSRYEGLGRVAVEAQAMNLPTLLSKHVPHEADVGGVYGFLNIDSPQTWADAMQMVYDDRPTIDIHDTLIGSYFDIENETKRLEEYYKSIL
ncbi:MAG: glycosyltransferase family 1 protein [Clostridia bacterium]|nr:glycosyltransferase family 1 protein [Clostridia bacterium]